MLDQENEVVQRAYSHIRSNTKAEMRFEEHLRPIRYVIAPGMCPGAPRTDPRAPGTSETTPAAPGSIAATRTAAELSPEAYAGRLVAPAMVAMLDAVDTVLFIPECVEDAMEVQVTLEEFREVGGLPETAGLADRWRIYHGQPEDVRWATMLIDMARFEGRVIDGEALTRSNPFAGEAEAAVCRHMNEEHTDDLRRMCAKYARIEIESPVMVGIDALGIDVRARFDVVRVQAIRPMHTREEARQVLTEMSKAAP